MTRDEFFFLKNNKRYIFECYYGDVFYGILVEDIQGFKTNPNIKYIVENKNIRNFNDSTKSLEEKISLGIMIPINIEIITHWEEQS